MNDEPTKHFDGATSFEERVLIEFGRIHDEFGRIHDEFGRVHTELADVRSDLSRLDRRVTALEETMEARLYDTRPMWETVQAGIERLDEKFDNMIRDLYEVRADVGLHDKRIKEIERRLNT